MVCVVSSQLSMHMPLSYNLVTMTYVDVWTSYTPVLCAAVMYELS